MKQKFCFLLLIILGHSGFAQTEAEQDYSPKQDYQELSLETTDVNERTWEKATRNLDYSPPRQRNRKRKNKSEKEGGDGSQLMTTLLIVFGGLIIALGVAYLLGYLKFKENKKAGPLKISIEDIEENIFETDLQAHIKDALEKPDYQLAVRLYFLSILKELSLQKKIKWKRDKTNRIYAFELQEISDQQEFQSLALIFDRIHYGSSTLMKKDFEQLQPQFIDFISKLNPVLLSNKPQK